MQFGMKLYDIKLFHIPNMRILSMKLVSLLFASTLLVAPTASYAACSASAPPISWSSEKEAFPVSVPEDAKNMNPLAIVIFRHGEKPLRDDGLMIEDGNLGRDSISRLSHLPDSLLSQFGCPDLLVSANPAIKMLNKKSGLYFNYVRPLATIEPLAQKIDFPVWTPYGYAQNDFLARDLLGDPALRPAVDGKTKKVFVSWERNNIAKLIESLKTTGRLHAPAGEVLMADGVRYRCEEPKKWEQCDFDTILLVNIRDSAICITPKSENLNSNSFLNRCKGAESTTDNPNK